MLVELEPDGVDGVPGWTRDPGTIRACSRECSGKARSVRTEPIAPRHKGIENRIDLDNKRSHDVEISCLELARGRQGRQKRAIERQEGLVGGAEISASSAPSVLGEPRRQFRDTSWRQRPAPLLAALAYLPKGQRRVEARGRQFGVATERSETVRDRGGTPPAA